MCIRDRSSIVNIHTLEPTEDSFRKTENEIGNNGGALAVADFSGDGQNELIIARGEVNLFQSCSTHSFCFEKNSQRLIGNDFWGTRLLPSIDASGDFVLLGSGPFQSYEFKKNSSILELISSHRLPAASFFRKHYYNCLLYTSPSPRDATLSRMPSSA